MLSWPLCEFEAALFLDCMAWVEPHGTDRGAYKTRESHPPVRGVLTQRVQRWEQVCEQAALEWLGAVLSIGCPTWPKLKDSLVLI